jgi:arylsulfatase A-like enzyme
MLRFHNAEHCPRGEAKVNRSWNPLLVGCCFALTIFGSAISSSAESTARLHIILVMADDQGWGETSYNGHPILKTPNLDAMATSGLRFDRFYAGAPVCSPTRATVLTGRTNDRTGTLSHGYALRRQEITIAQILRRAGYMTGHFGKWHLNGLRGPGVPVLKDDSHHPGVFGFNHWLSVTNFFDRDPILSRLGEFEDHTGDSSEIVVDEALKFIKQRLPTGSPTFTVIWYGTPHNPFKASEEDRATFTELDEQSSHHYGELVAMDRSIGTLRSGLRKLDIHDNTLLWFCSDNGGLPRIKPTTVGPLRGFKGTVYEGGLRVPAILQWPAGIESPHSTEFPATVADILPTLLAITGLSHPDSGRPLDGIDLVPVFDDRATQRERPMFFRHNGRAALIDNHWKLLTTDLTKQRFELYDLKSDPSEGSNLVEQRPQELRRMREQFDRWNQSVNASLAGEDYPEGKVNAGEPQSRFWSDQKEYEPYFDQWRTRWEYGTWLKRRGK